MTRIAMISVHGSPIAPFGSRETGGMNVYIRELTRQLGRLGYDIDMFTRWADSDLPRVVELDPRSRVIHLPMGEIGPMSKHEVGERLPEFYCGLRRYQQETGQVYDVIHSHYWLSGWVGGLISHRWDAPHVTMFHTLAELKQVNRLGESESADRVETERRVIATADAIVAATAHERASMARLYGADSRRVSVIPCGIDLDHFKPGAKRRARHQLGFGDDRVLLFIGRLEPLKGLDVLIGAAAQLTEIPNLRVVVVGGNPAGDPEREKLEQLARDLGVAERITFVGPQDRSILPTYYRAADLTVTPSLYESFCLVAAESLASGTPVVATKVGGLATLVRDGVNGFAVPWRTPEAFADRLRLALTNEPLRRRLAAGARPSVQQYAWSKVAGDVAGLYQSLIAAKRASRIPVAR